MPVNAAPVHTPADPCRLCDHESFHVVYSIDPKRPPYNGPRGVKYMGGLVQALKCLNCGTWDRVEVKRTGPVRIVRPVRPAVVASLRMGVRIH